MSAASPALGVDAALADDPGFARGLNVKDGEIAYERVPRPTHRGAVAAW